jgi:hypothetical protein
VSDLTALHKEIKKQQTGLFPLLGVSAFCLLFSQIYLRFSHGVSSPYMSLLFLWPLLLGAVPILLLRLLRKTVPEAASSLWFSGVAALTVRSALIGVLAIAGTSSPYTAPLLWIGIGLMVIGTFRCHV